MSEDINPFLIEKSPQPEEFSLDTIKTIIEAGIAKLPYEEWEEKIWKMLVSSVSNIDPRDLRDIYDEQVSFSKPAKEIEAIKIKEKELYDQFKQDKTGTTYHLADYITKKYSIITIGEKEQEIYVYQNGYYQPAENLIIFPEIQRILKDQVTRNAKSETLHKIADATTHPRTIFSSTDVRFIPLKNGVYDFVTKQLLPHSPEYRFLYQFPITYNPKAQCPKTSAFLDQVLTAEQRLTVEEWLGYYFYRLYSFKKAIIFVGDGDTGKTTLLETITYLLGKENISSVSLHKMVGDKFAAAHLYDKHGNIVDELSAKDVSDTGNFKIATGGGSINGEYKYGNQFSFTNFSKLTFACNKIPDVKDMNDEAYFNRWMVIRFEKTIEKKIPNFIATLTTEEERSGLFNLAMIGLERLLTNGRFTYASTAIDTKQEMLRSGSSIAMFVSDRLVEEQGSEISKAGMYEAYTDYCNEKGLSSETMDMFGKKFLFYIAYASEGYITESSGKRSRGWRNVKVLGDDNRDKKADEEFNSLG